MAKCIKRKMRSKIERVSDEMAAALVSDGKAEYVSKSKWKRYQEQGKPPEEKK